MARKDKVKKSRKNTQDDGSSISFAGKCIFYISKAVNTLRDSTPIKRAVSRQKELVKARCGTDSGYAATAVGMRLSRILLIIALVITILLGVIFSAGRLAVDNVYYMALDIGYMNSYNEKPTGKLNYTKPQHSGDYALYKNGLVSASNNEIKIFNATGRVTLTSGDIFAEPVIVTSNKYFIVYDLGGHKFSVYNSFKRIETVSLDGKIAYAAMCEDGDFVIVEKTQDYNSVVRTYNESCELVSKYSTSGYALSAEMSENGKYTAVLTTSVKDGEMSAKLTVLKQNRKRVYAEVELEGVTPYECRFIDNNRIAVVCADRAYIYSINGKLKGEYTYPEGRLAYVSYTQGSMALLFEQDVVNGRNSLAVIGKNGKLQYSEKIQGSFTDMQVYDNYVFLLTNNGIYKLNYDTGIMTVREGKDTFGKILVCDKNKILLCTDSRGIYYNME